MDMNWIVIGVYLVLFKELIIMIFFLYRIEVLERNKVSIENQGRFRLERKIWKEECKCFWEVINKNLLGINMDKQIIFFCFDF